MIYTYKTEGRSPKYFSNYQNLIDLFIDLRYGNLNPKEVLKNQINFKADLDEKKKKKKKSKNKNRKQKCNTNFFSLKRKNYYFFRYYSFLLSEAKYKAKYERGLKMLTPKQELQRLPIALAQVKADNTSENLSDILYIFYIEQKKLLRNYTTT